MAHAGICNVDCKLEIDANGRRAHIMYAAEPSSAAGRYQWELNRDLLARGRRAWRASGQGQSRACRVWDNERATTPDHYPVKYGILGRRFGRELSDMLAE